MRILMVDDDLQILDLLKRVAESVGYHEVKTVASGEEAVAEVIRSHYDLITLDVRMPGLTGLEVLSVIRTMSSHAIIAIVSAHIPEDVPAEVAGCADVMISKPLDMENFQRLISSAGVVCQHMEVIRGLGSIRTSVR